MLENSERVMRKGGRLEVEERINSRLGLWKIEEKKSRKWWSGSGAYTLETKEYKLWYSVGLKWNYILVCTYMIVFYWENKYR